jgi:hypothetical protein
LDRITESPDPVFPILSDIAYESFSPQVAWPLLKKEAGGDFPEGLFIFLGVPKG